VKVESLSGRLNCSRTTEADLTRIEHMESERDSAVELFYGNAMRGAVLGSAGLVNRRGTPQIFRLKIPPNHPTNRRQIG